MMHSSPASMFAANNGFSVFESLSPFFVTSFVLALVSLFFVLPLGSNY